ncbi:MAG TPA: hypothetical protein DIC60_10590 [Lachnospiraceae bacterium]|nr:hypothetical protein [Lachnospiraceae bacterium]
MLVTNVNNTKEFMAMLLKKDTFDAFEVREVIITTFTTFEIRCNLNKDFFDSEEELSRKYCLWSELKPHVFELIKGNKLPKSIKIVFSANDALLQTISLEASSLFINVTFENNCLRVITGSSLKIFTLNKTVEFMWDEWVINFLEGHKISISAPKEE